MEIILGKTAGFCNGITRAVETAKEELKNTENLDCLGDLLHNNQVLNKLKANGLRIITDIKEAKERVLIRAHGVKKEVYEYASKNNIELIDCTCPKVLKIHDLAEELSNKDYYILVIGFAILLIQILVIVGMRKSQKPKEKKKQIQNKKNE